MISALVEAMLDGRVICYLAGERHSPWRKYVIQQVPGIYFVASGEPGGEPSPDGIPWDLHAIRCAGVVLAYLDKEDPSGLELNLEIGYAHALEIPIILVNEQDDNPYMSMAESVATVVYEKLVDGIELLQCAHAESLSFSVEEG